MHLDIKLILGDKALAEVCALLRAFQFYWHFVCVPTVQTTCVMFS